MDQKKLLRHICSQIVKHYQPEKIILFGSRAYGKPRHDSDFDLFIIKRTRRRDVERIREVSDIFGLRDFGLDIIVRTPAEVKQRLSWGDFFYKEILTKGEVLYEKK